MVVSWTKINAVGILSFRSSKFVVNGWKKSWLTYLDKKKSLEGLQPLFLPHFQENYSNFIFQQHGAVPIGSHVYKNSPMKLSYSPGFLQILHVFLFLVTYIKDIIPLGKVCDEFGYRFDLSRPAIEEHIEIHLKQCSFSLLKSSLLKPHVLC